MKIKPQQKSEVTKFSTENGKLIFNGKSYNESNVLEKQEFNYALVEEKNGEEILQMIKEMIKPLLVTHLPELKERELERIKPYFV